MLLSRFLTFSFATFVSDSLTILTSVIEFIKDNTLLIGIVGISLVSAFVFAILNRLR